MEKSIGERLRDERKKQGLSIEDVAHATRIHANTVLGLEADDYSGFASTTYAKSFLKKYAAHLGVDASDALAQFSSDATSPIVGGANYIRSVADAIEPVERISGLSDSGNFAHVGSEPSKKSRRNNGGGSHPIALGMFLVVLLAAVGVLIKIGYKAETPEEARRNLHEIFGGDDSGEAAAQNSASSGEVDARPGTRVSPAAPMTRPSKPKKPVEEDENSDPQPPFMGPPLKPLAQANIQNPATPVAKPIRATPVIVTPVVLPTEAEDEKKTAENGNGEPNSSEPNSEDAVPETE